MRSHKRYFPSYDHTTALTIAGVDSLRSRREELARRFFTRHVLNETPCLHYTCCHQSETRTLLLNFKEPDFVRTVKQIPTHLKLVYPISY